MRYINLRFTYLLTYLLTDVADIEISLGQGSKVPKQEGEFVITIISGFIVRLLQLDHRCIATVKMTRANKSQQNIESCTKIM